MKRWSVTGLKIKPIVTVLMNRAAGKGSVVSVLLFIWRARNFRPVPFRPMLRELMTVLSGDLFPLIVNEECGHQTLDPSLTVNVAYRR